LEAEEVTDLGRVASLSPRYMAVEVASVVEASSGTIDGAVAGSMMMVRVEVYVRRLLACA